MTPSAAPPLAMSDPLAEPDLDEDRLGVLPMRGPVPYLTDSELQARRLLGGTPPRHTVAWLHATSAEVARVAAHRGLVPSCWRVGETAVWSSARPTPMM
jgi:hypothetical protein